MGNGRRINPIWVAVEEWGACLDMAQTVAKMWKTYTPAIDRMTNNFRILLI